MKNIISIFLLSVLVVSTSFGQTRKAYIKAAEGAMVNENYYEALTFYNEALEFKENDPEIIFKSAEAARKFHAYELASAKYSYLVDTLENKNYPSSYVHIGSTLLKQGEYDKAQTYLNKYISDYSGTDAVLAKKAEGLIENAKWAKEKAANPDLSVSITQLGDGVNTIYSDFGGTIFNDVLYYSTMKHEEEGIKKEIPRSISKIHTYDNSESLLIENKLNENNSLKANPTFSYDGSKLIYTICEYTPTNAIECKLYSRTVLEDGEYGEKVELNQSINAPGFTTTHPNLGYDAVKDKEVLYFTSNKLGGKGGYDIYYSVYNSAGELSEPVNMSDINTEFDELTPYLASNAGKLYYSTEGVKGLGGFDIYSVDINNLTVEPEHMSAPINSSYDDIYFTYDEKNNESYFSSNRATSAKIDDVTKACCFDIYNVQYSKIILELDAMTFDSITREAISGASVELIDKSTGEIIEVVENLDGNSHEFLLERGKEYIIVAKKENYKDYTTSLSTANMSESTKIVKKLYMYTPQSQIDIFGFDNATKEALAGTKIVITNTTDGTFETIELSNMTNNDYHVFLKNGHKYNVTMSKFGYVTKTEVIDLTDVSDGELIEKNIYLDVFLIEEYKNTAVYFENDYPNPKSRSVKTDTRYGDHYNFYLTHKGEYFDRVQDNMKITDKASANADVEAFFTNDVIEGYDMFKKFMRALKAELGNDRNLEVQLKGYASPLAKDAYNKALSNRRVNSVRLDILNYENGYFRDFIENGRLIITDVSFGEERAPAGISDDRSNVTESIYSIKAARERRVEIIKISDQ